ncbi:MAG: hypothetical protein EXR36_03100 [Betaproteobacteria bacterium]|nr:hypothetical protein [Betaproteobacteria bacterium]
MGSRIYFQSTTKHARPIVSARDYQSVKSLLKSTTVLGLVANRGEYRVEALIRELVEYESTLNGTDQEYCLGWTEYVRVPRAGEETSETRRWSDM